MGIAAAGEDGLPGHESFVVVAALPASGQGSTWRNSDGSVIEQRRNAALGRRKFRIIYVARMLL
jgi:hypothetical protein